MRKIFYGIIAFITFIILPCVAGGIENTYKMCGCVYDFETIEDETGNLWWYDTTLDEGSKLIITFDNMGTPDRADDQIIRVKRH